MSPADKSVEKEHRLFAQDWGLGAVIGGWEVVIVETRFLFRMIKVS